ncbi:uncharacterized protein LOC144115605 [Amblyomma americanum]
MAFSGQKTFESVECSLVAYNVSKEHWAQLVFPVLAERVAYLSTRFTAEQHRDYDKLKAVVLDVLKLSAAEYQRRFSGATKRREETWKAFATRVQSYLNFYLKSRCVSSFDGLLKLLVADQLKAGLSEEAHKYVKLREGEKWLNVDEIAALLQTYEEAAGKGSAQKKADSIKGFDTPPKPRTEAPPTRKHGAERGDRIAAVRPGGEKKKVSRSGGCFRCGSWRHVANCPFDRENPADRRENLPRDDRLTARVSTHALQSTRPALRDIKICSREAVIGAIVDTGADITVVRESLVPEEFVSPHGTIDLVSAFGEKVEAKLAVVPLALCRGAPLIENVDDATPVLCTLTDKLTQADCLISADAWEQLHDSGKTDSESLVQAVGTLSPPAEDRPDRSGPDVGTEPVLAFADETLPQQTVDSNEVEPSQAGGTAELSGAQKFRAEQHEDETLRQAWQNAKQGKAGMSIVDGVLYHKDQVLGQGVQQLVLPRLRCEAALSLAHESYWGGQLGFRKTKARLKYSFYWPGMESDIRKHCDSCHSCQVRSDHRRTDRVPITPLTRPKFPFQKVNADIIGPIEPSSGRGHRYALCIIDLYTRWPEVVCLRSLSARATCDALLSVFSRTGVPEVR